MTLIYYYHSESILDRAINNHRKIFDMGFAFINMRRAGYELKKVEVYYLIADFEQFNELSLEDYDAERINGVLIWSGMI
jgi:hypothetical protein